jgi:hypothetical protein
MELFCSIYQVDMPDNGTCNTLARPSPPQCPHPPSGELQALRMHVAGRKARVKLYTHSTDNASNCCQHSMNHERCYHLIVLPPALP